MRLQRFLWVAACLLYCAAGMLTAGEPSASPPLMRDPAFHFVRRDAIRALQWTRQREEDADKTRRRAADVEKQLAAARQARDAAQRRAEELAERLNQAQDQHRQQQQHQASLSGQVESAQAAVAVAKERMREADRLRQQVLNLEEEAQVGAREATAELAVSVEETLETTQAALAAAARLARSAEQAQQAAETLLAEAQDALAATAQSIQSVAALVTDYQHQAEQVAATQAEADRLVERKAEAAKPFLDVKSAAEKSAAAAQSLSNWAVERVRMLEAGPVRVDPASVRELRVFKHDRPVISCRIDPTGQYLFAGARDAGVHRWDLITGSYTRLDGHVSWVRRFELHPTEPLLVSGDYSGNLLWWNPWDDQPRAIRGVLAHRGFARGVAISPDRRFIATGGNDNCIKIWSTDDGSLVRELVGHERHVYNVAFHPDGRSLYSGDLMGNVKQWNVDDWSHVRNLDATVLHTYDKGFRADCGGIRGLDFSPDGSQLAVCGMSEVTNAFAGVGKPTVALFDLKSGERRNVMLPAEHLDGPCSGVRYHSSGQFLAGTGGSGSGALWFWKPDQDRAFHTLKLPAVGYDLAFHPDGLRLAIALYDQTIRLYDLAAKTEVARRD